MSGIFTYLCLFGLICCNWRSVEETESVFSRAYLRRACLWEDSWLSSSRSLFSVPYSSSKSSLADSELDLIFITSWWFKRCWCVSSTSCLISSCWSGTEDVLWPPVLLADPVLNCLSALKDWELSFRSYSCSPLVLIVGSAFNFACWAWKPCARIWISSCCWFILVS